MTAAELRERLLEAVDRRRRDVLAKSWGYERPDPGKLIREGLGIAERCIEAVPLAEQGYLDAVIAALHAAKDRERASGISDDGWADEDGWILGGIGGVIADAEALREP